MHTCCNPSSLGANLCRGCVSVVELHFLDWVILLSFPVAVKVNIFLLPLSESSHSFPVHRRLLSLSIHLFLSRACVFLLFPICSFLPCVIFHNPMQMFCFMFINRWYTLLLSFLSLWYSFHGFLLFLSFPAIQYSAETCWELHRTLSCVYSPH